MSLFTQAVRIVGAIGAVATSVTSRGAKGALAIEILDAGGEQVVGFGGSALVTEKFDYVAVTSANGAGDPLVIEYRLGGSGGTLVATLTLTYDGSGNFATVTKT